MSEEIEKNILFPQIDLKQLLYDDKIEQYRKNYLL